MCFLTLGWKLPSSRDQCAILPNRIAPALGPGLCWSLLSSTSSPRVLVQRGDTLAHLVAASLCPEGCSELLSLPSMRGWCDHGVNVLCYSQAAHLCSPLSASPPTVPSATYPWVSALFPVMQGLLCPWYFWWRVCCSPAPVTVPASVPRRHSPLCTPLPWQQALHHCSVPCPGCPLPSAPSQQPPCHQDITSEEKWGGV